MTRHEICDRVRDELEAAFPGEQAFEVASVDDVDTLDLAIREVIDDCREVLASAQREKEGT